MKVEVKGLVQDSLVGTQLKSGEVYIVTGLPEHSHWSIGQPAYVNLTSLKIDNLITKTWAEAKDTNYKYRPLRPGEQVVISGE
jgi:hypothetical protein